uniref:Secreted protein n=1 Tax=Brassica campestris TaxID=3711 RepID=A0A3P6A9Z2_BRACM|nr:unnamed protein product [Brassica rapa]
MSRCRFRLLLVITIVPGIQVDIRVSPGSHANEHSGKKVRSWLMSLNSFVLSFKKFNNRISCKSIDDMSSDKLCSCVLMMTIFQLCIGQKLISFTFVFGES